MPCEQRLHQPQQAVAAQPEVLAVARGVLRHQAELLDAGRFELARLLHQALDGAAAEAAAPERDRAEGARVVAALGDLEVGVARRREPARVGVIEQRARAGARRRRRAAEADQRVGAAQVVERRGSRRSRGSRRAAPGRTAAPCSPRPAARAPTPSSFLAAISRMVSIDSCLASSMKPQVLTITVSAASRSGVSS